jgi:hypothetical protein
MISDSLFHPVCKKYGGLVVYWDYELEKQFGHLVKHDFMWRSNYPRPEDIDPNYEPRRR